MFVQRPDVGFVLGVLVFAFFELFLACFDFPEFVVVEDVNVGSEVSVFESSFCDVVFVFLFQFPAELEFFLFVFFGVLWVDVDFVAVSAVAVVDFAGVLVSSAFEVLFVHLSFCRCTWRMFA